MRYFAIVFFYLVIVTSSVLGQDLTSANDYSQRGISRFEKNDLEGAIADFTKVIEMNGQSLEFVYYFRGMAHYRKGNPDQAILDFTKAISIKPDPRFYDDRGDLLAKRGELDQAIADLNKAIEIAPRYAKAYGDRGLVRLMRGEDKDSELDFKKCFELDSALESQFRDAATKVKQRKVSASAQEKPEDVEVIKFEWSKANSKVFVGPSSQTIPVTATPVSATGTRVLADPNAKGEPGPPEVADSSGLTRSSARGSSENTRDVIQYQFNASLRNTGTKTIVAVKWAYFFEPKDPAHERLAYLFMTKTNIKPGTQKTLHDLLPSTGGPKGSIKLPDKNNEALFNERIAILRLDYADGSSWESSASAGAPQKNGPPH